MNINNKKEHSYECSFLISSFLSSRAASSQVLSAFVSLTSVFGMGTGVSSQLSPLFLLKIFLQNYIEVSLKSLPRLSALCVSL